MCRLRIIVPSSQIKRVFLELYFKAKILHFTSYLQKCLFKELPFEKLFSEPKFIILW